MISAVSETDYIYSVSDPTKTGFQFVSLADAQTGYNTRTIVSNTTLPAPSFMAWVGSRYSRSADSVLDLAKELSTAGVDTDQKLAGVFRGYGHASVADMAQIMIYLEGLPDTYAVRLFYESSIGGGQHRSTRYQDFSQITPVPLHYYMRLPILYGIASSSVLGSNNFDKLDQEFQGIQRMGIDFYKKYVDVLNKAYISTYEIINPTKAEQSALRARVFDSARYFLPNGTCLETSCAWQTSAREWARIISVFKASQDLYLQRLGYQIEALLAPDKDLAKNIGYLPEAAELIRYTQSDETTSNNLINLQAYLEEINFLDGAVFDHIEGFRPTKVEGLYADTDGDLIAVMQYILTLYPTLDTKWLIEKLETMDDITAGNIGEIIFANFTQHKQMGVQARTNTHSFLLRLGIGEARDLNRHRAWGRFLPYLSSENDLHSIIKGGFTLPLYLTENPLLESIKHGFEADMVKYFAKISRFMEAALSEEWFPKEVLTQLLPFATAVTMWMHGSPKEESYFTHLREAEGGHINYRMLAFDMAELLSERTRFLKAFALPSRPDAKSRKQFLSRK